LRFIGTQVTFASKIQTMHLTNYVQLLRQLPKYVDCAVVAVAPTVLTVDIAGVAVVNRHARFSMYCVKLEALNVVAVSLIFVCTTQTSIEKSTATHIKSSKHSARHSDSDKYWYKFPCKDATPSFLFHNSQPAKHADIYKTNDITAGFIQQ